MHYWSEERQEITRTDYFPGAIVKDKNHMYGVLVLQKGLFEIHAFE